jgi:iron(III) transport system ATP-binding protein
LVAVTAVSIKGVTKRFDTTTAVDDVDLEVHEGEFLTLVGPSGCGKTTLLRMIAGLETPTSGEIEILGETVFSRKRRVNVQPHARHIGMVFQSYALWPHMTAFDNVAFPLRRASARRWHPGRARRTDIEERVIHALRIVHCEGLAGRHPGEMSGGQQQRVALARAIVGSPKLILMDEPLSNLDAKLRARLRFELRAIQQELGFTALYVTHDRAEAISMSDVVVVLRDGRIEQMGPPEEVYHHPATSYVSDFLGDHNLVHGRVVRREGNTIELDTPLGRVTTDRPTSPGLEVGRPIIAAIARGAIVIERPARREVAGEGSGEACNAVVRGVGYYGWYSEVLLRMDPGDEVTVRLDGRTDLQPGESVRAHATEPASVEADDLTATREVILDPGDEDHLATGKALA